MRAAELADGTVEAKFRSCCPLFRHEVKELARLLGLTAWCRIQSRLGDEIGPHDLASRARASGEIPVTSPASFSMSSKMDERSSSPRLRVD